MGATYTAIPESSKGKCMKKVICYGLIFFASGVVALVVMNVLEFKPLDFEKNDPNSNAALIGIIYFIIGVMFLGRGPRNRGTIIEKEEYTIKDGYYKDLKDDERKFPYAIVFIICGVIFIGIYFILNRI